MCAIAFRFNFQIFERFFGHIVRGRQTVSAQKVSPFGRAGASAPERARPLSGDTSPCAHFSLTKGQLIAAYRLCRAGLALSVPFGDTARVAAPSVCFAAARILLAAAPTAPPCFRRWRRSSPLLLSRGGLGIPESLASSPEAPLLGELSAKQTERLYGGKPDRERKPLPRGEPFHLHDTAPLRWNKWQSSYKLNDTSFNIDCLPTWQSSPDWQTTYFASWAQVCHLGKVRFTALVR